jgi:D-alanyl-D-alanine carboxypeptidase
MNDLFKIKSKKGTRKLFPKQLVLTIGIITCLFFQLSLPVLADDTGSESVSSDLQQQADMRKTLPIQTNDIKSWPTGPQISAEAAILMEADTGTILYGKNIHEKLYPASTTKMLTCLVAAEHSSLDEMVTFSENAVKSVPSDGSSIGVNAGESMPMEQCLYAILVASANEVATAVGEHVGGNVDNFVAMMNQKAKDLGCTDSHFSNCNGLFVEDHYTSAHDLALIARAFFNNDILYRIGNTPTHHFAATSTQHNDFYKTNKHKLITGETAYTGIIGGKTGFTDEARQTLVTGCEQNGMRLICVVLKEEAPSQFNDTVTLFDYGYQNFTKVNIAENDKTYSIGSDNFYHTGKDIFKNTTPVLSIDPSDYVILPNMASFDDLKSTLKFLPSGSDHIADIQYTYQNTLWLALLRSWLQKTLRTAAL